MPNQRSRTDDARSLAATPGLQRLLDRLGRRLTALVWMHGLGTLLAALSLWLAFAFLADWALHVPGGVGWFHVAVLLSLPLAIGWFELARHLARPYTAWWRRATRSE